MPSNFETVHFFFFPEYTPIASCLWMLFLVSCSVPSMIKATVNSLPLLGSSSFTWVFFLSLWLGIERGESFLFLTPSKQTWIIFSMTLRQWLSLMPKHNANTWSLGCCLAHNRYSTKQSFLLRIVLTWNTSSLSIFSRRFLDTPKKVWYLFSAKSRNKSVFFNWIWLFFWQIYFFLGLGPLVAEEGEAHGQVEAGQPLGGTVFSCPSSSRWSRSWRRNTSWGTRESRRKFANQASR